VLPGSGLFLFFMYSNPIHQSSTSHNALHCSSSWFAITGNLYPFVQFGQALITALGWLIVGCLSEEGTQ